MLTATAEQRQAAQQSEDTQLDSAQCLLAAFAALGLPSTMLDVGCGPTGHLVRIAHALGVDAAGVDISLRRESEYPLLLRYDLRNPWSPPPAGLVLCLEVAEHLPPESADTLCDTLANATGETLLFSAAIPGQGGSGHLNEQPHDYWREKLEARGLWWDVALTDTLRTEWAKVAPRAWWYSRNVMAFSQTDRKDGA